jgi:hypothetical protein
VTAGAAVSLTREGPADGIAAVVAAVSSMGLRVSLAEADIWPGYTRSSLALSARRARASSGRPCDRAV